MNTMEMVELLREKANISYEDAKRVLEEANGDLLDAMVILERQGKIRKPETEIVSRQAEASDDTADKKAKEAGTAKKVGNAMRKILNILKNNSFCISKNEKSLFVMPAWTLALILLFFWETVIPIMLISLFFGIKYSFTGNDDLSEVNSFMDKASDMADQVTNEFKTA